MQIRRERRAVAESGVSMRVLTGDQVQPELMALIFHIYKRTVDRNVWGRQYLNEHFFTMLAQRFRHRLCLVLAVRNGDVVGATFNVLKDGVLYGRYWGSLQESRFLHFETCYYTPLQHAISHGWRRFEPGAGTPDSRHTRGFRPVATHSVHFFCDGGLHSAVAERLQAQRERRQGGGGGGGARERLQAPRERQTVLRGSRMLEGLEVLDGLAED